MCRRLGVPWGNCSWQCKWATPVLQKLKRPRWMKSWPPPIPSVWATHEQLSADVTKWTCIREYLPLTRPFSDARLCYGLFPWCLILIFPGALRGRCWNDLHPRRECWLLKLSELTPWRTGSPETCPPNPAPYSLFCEPFLEFHPIQYFFPEDSWQDGGWYGVTMQNSKAPDIIFAEMVWIDS